MLLNSAFKIELHIVRKLDKYWNMLYLALSSYVPTETLSSIAFRKLRVVDIPTSPTPGKHINHQSRRTSKIAFPLKDTVQTLVCTPVRVDPVCNACVCVLPTANPISPATRCGGVMVIYRRSCCCCCHPAGRDKVQTSAHPRRPVGICPWIDTIRIGPDPRGCHDMTVHFSSASSTDRWQWSRSHTSSIFRKSFAIDSRQLHVRPTLQLQSPGGQRWVTISSLIKHTYIPTYIVGSGFIWAGWDLC